MGYVSASEYAEICGTNAPILEAQRETELSAAEKDIDALTFNRITACGFDALTPFQQDLVRRAVCAQANFRYEYGGMLSNPLASYGINGVSMSWDNSKVQNASGVYTPTGVLSLLLQTGLTYRGVCG